MRISDWSSDVCSSDLYLAGLAQLDLAIHAHRAAGDQRLAGTAAVANPHQLEQLVEFDEVAVELEVELVHGETGEASTTASRYRARRANGLGQPSRSEERRGGKEGVSMVRYRVSPTH